MEVDTSGDADNAVEGSKGFVFYLPRDIEQVPNPNPNPNPNPDPDPNSSPNSKSNPNPNRDPTFHAASSRSRIS